MTEPRFTIADTPLAGLKLVTRRAMGDKRGFLSRLFDAQEMRAAGYADQVVQINHTFTRTAGAIRGMHFQHPPFAEDKLVSVLQGEVLDVAVDLRAGSPTFLAWHGERLSGENLRSLIIPKGFAHGFQTLTPGCELIYLHTQRYEPEAEGALNPFDPRLSIDWPLEATDISARDRAHPMIAPDFAGIQ